jgi:hypothetical protein
MVEASYTELMCNINYPAIGRILSCYPREIADKRLLKASGLSLRFNASVPLSIGFQKSYQAFLSSNCQSSPFWDAVAESHIEKAPHRPFYNLKIDETPGRISNNENAI